MTYFEDAFLQKALEIFHIHSQNARPLSQALICGICQRQGALVSNCHKWLYRNETKRDLTRHVPRFYISLMLLFLYYNMSYTWALAEGGPWLMDFQTWYKYSR